MVAMAAALSGADVYVSARGDDRADGSARAPVATLERARDIVRLQKKKTPDEDFRIVLADGIYRLNKTVVFDLSDSMPPGRTLSVEAAPGARPVLTSTVLIGGWRKLGGEAPAGLPQVARGHIWVADLPAPSGGIWRFRTLYDGGMPLPRARSRAYALGDTIGDGPRLLTHWRNRDWFRFPDGALHNWSNLDDVEVFVRPFEAWVVNYLPVASVDEAQHIAHTALQGTYTLSGGPGRFDGRSLWVENVPEALDEPGEWIVNTHERKLYYWPVTGRPGDQIQAPRLQELVRVEGRNVDELTGDVPVRGLVFRGLTFTGGDRDLWTREDRGLQHDWEMYDKGNALLRFRGAEDCAVTDCRFVFSGGSGVRVDLYGQHLAITGSHFDQLGAAGVILAGYGPGHKDVNHSHLIRNNEMSHLGRLFWHSPAILVWQSGRNRILNNHIHDLPYNGIVLSGVRPRFFGITDPVKWLPAFRDAIPADNRENMRVIRRDEVGPPADKAELLPLAHARDNLVQDNEIHHTMQRLGDGNSVYLSCSGSGNVIRRNVCYASPGAQFDIRFDDDQQDAVVAENIILGNGVMLKHRNRVVNNIVIGGGVIVRREIEPGAEIAYNIFYQTPGRHRIFSTNDGDGSLDAMLAVGHPDRDFFAGVDASGAAEQLREAQAWNLESSGATGEPGFADFAAGDFRLAASSAARALGILSIDVERIGRAGDPPSARLAAEIAAMLADHPLSTPRR